MFSPLSLARHLPKHINVILTILINKLVMWPDSDAVSVNLGNLPGESWIVHELGNAPDERVHGGDDHFGKKRFGSGARDVGNCFHHQHQLLFGIIERNWGGQNMPKTAGARALI